MVGEERFQHRAANTKATGCYRRGIEVTTTGVVERHPVRPALGARLMYTRLERPNSGNISADVHPLVGVPMQYQCFVFTRVQSLPNMHLVTTRRVVNAGELNRGCCLAFVVYSPSQQI